MRWVVAVILLGTRRIDFRVATLSQGRASTGQCIIEKDECHRGRWFLERSVLGNSWAMFSGRSSACTLLSVLESFWWDGTRVLILVQLGNWLLQMPPFASSFSKLQREGGADWFGSGSGSWSVACTLNRLVKILFRIMNPLWKLEWVKTADKLMTKILHDGWDHVAEADRIQRIWHAKKSRCKLTLRMWLKFKYETVGCFIYK